MLVCQFKIFVNLADCFSTRSKYFSSCVFSTSVTCDLPFVCWFALPMPSVENVCSPGFCVPKTAQGVWASHCSRNRGQCQHTTWACECAVLLARAEDFVLA